MRLGKLGYLNQVGLVSVCAKFQLSSWSRSDLIYFFGWVGGWNGWLEKVELRLTAA